MLSLIKKYKLIVTLTLLLFGVKIAINSLLLAENGDTYDFFKIAYFLQQFNLDYASKRMPFLPLLLAPFPSQYFVEVGRVWINLFYILTVILSYKYFYLLSDKSKFLKLKVFKVYKVKFRNFYSLCFSLVIATNILIFENSFYILADTIFLFFNVYYLYIVKKHGLKKPILLAAISALAFYTRPEGALLFTITGVLYCLRVFSKTNRPGSKFTIFNFQFSKKTLLNALLFVVVGLILIAPYFLRNYYYYNSFFYSGYLEDEAGFIFNTSAIMLRFSNFLYAVGGVWLLPTLYILIRNFRIGSCEVPTYREKLEVGSFKLIKNNFTPEILVFLLYSLALFIWGPYPRLYSVPVFLTLVFTYYLLIKIKSVKNKWYDILIVSGLFLVSSIFYIYVVQFLDQTDFGYRKLGKGFAILMSAPILGYFYLYSIKRISKKYLLVLFTATVVLINLVVFVDKFRITRYKYYTIKQATIFATMPGVSLGSNIYYSSGSGLETWYLKDFEQKYFYKGSTQTPTFINNAKINGVTHYITTEEMGYKDNLSNVSIDKIPGEVIKVYKSPFFPGETKVVRIQWEKMDLEK